jgi:hypothetical protein
MLMPRSPLTLALSALLLAAAACGGDDKKTSTGPDEAPNPFDAPSGAVYQLPAGVAVQGKIVGAGGDSGNGVCETEETVGAGAGFVDICLTFTNSGAEPDTIALPPELIFISKNTDTQNGAVVVGQTVVVPAGGDTTVTVSLFCVNLRRHAADAADEFTIGPLSDNAGLREVATLVQGKSIDGQGSFVVQGAVWEVSDAGGLTAETRQALRDLPAAGGVSASMRPVRVAPPLKPRLRG